MPTHAWYPSRACKCLPATDIEFKCPMAAPCALRRRLRPPRPTSASAPQRHGVDQAPDPPTVPAGPGPDGSPVRRRPPSYGVCTGAAAVCRAAGHAGQSLLPCAGACATCPPPIIALPVSTLSMLASTKAGGHPHTRPHPSSMPASSCSCWRRKPGRRLRWPRLRSRWRRRRPSWRT